ncbi:MAG: short-chain dehydrogenase/reductase [Firmicutes bacterium]|nr:short-chain dehydrogenase/reductase [Bacillota bacterium]
MNVKEMFSLTGKTAIVTGGASGIGAQLATGLAEAGANLVIAARKVERCKDMCDKLMKDNGIKAIAVACDVSKEEDCRNLVDAALKEYGHLDILVNNAGTSWGADSLNFPMDKWRMVMDLNVNGMFQLSAMAAKAMKEKGLGKIINIASMGAFGADKPDVVNAIPYTASKGAVVAMTRDMAAKWAQYGIYVNAICPGWFPTDMSGKVINRDGGEKFTERIPLGRFGGPDDLKGMVVLLASGASNFITGQSYLVDGGQTILL